LRLKILKKLITASLNSEFTSFYKKKYIKVQVHTVIFQKPLTQSSNLADGKNKISTIFDNTFSCNGAVIIWNCNNISHTCWM